MSKEEFNKYYNYVYGGSISEEPLNESVIKRLKRVLQNPKVKSASIPFLIGIISPFISMGQNTEVIKNTEGVQNLLNKVYKATGDTRFKVGKDSLANMSGDTFQALMDDVMAAYEKTGGYVKGSDSYKQNKDKIEKAQVIKKIDYLVPANEFKAQGIPEKERFKYEYGIAKKKGLKTFWFKKDNGKKVEIAIIDDPNATPIKTSSRQDNKQTTKWYSAKERERIKNEGLNHRVNKIYISEDAYNQLNEDKQSVDSFRAKLEGVIHHLKPFMEMSDQELDELIHEHDWLDEQMTQIETIAQNIGHFAEIGWKYFDDEVNEQALSEKKEKRDRCLRIADRKYEKPSAYKSGAVVRCRKGDIWKNEK